jgi:hypothetical protein
VFGVGERAIELGPEMLLGLIGASPTDNQQFVNAAAMARGEVIVNQDDGDTMDKLNRINPFYATGIDVVKADEAQEKGDWIRGGRASMDC